MKLERVFLFALCIGCLFWLADDASAATIHVRQDGTGDADNIQDGIYMADVADTVLVHDSDWNLGYSDYSSGNGSNSNSALEIPSSKTGLTLKGYGDDRVSLNAYARYGDYENHAYVLHVAADNVKVENFRFRENYGNYYSSGVKISGDDVTLDDVRVELSHSYNTNSITITGTSGFTIRDSEWYTTDYYAGLYGTDVSGVTFEGSNQIISYGNTGIYLMGNGTQVIGGTLKISSASIQNYFYFESVTVTGAIFSGTVA